MEIIFQGGSSVGPSRRFRNQTVSFRLPERFKQVMSSTVGEPIRGEHVTEQARTHSNEHIPFHPLPPTEQP